MRPLATHLQEHCQCDPKFKALAWSNEPYKQSSCMAKCSSLRDGNFCCDRMWHANPKMNELNYNNIGILKCSLHTAHVVHLFLHASFLTLHPGAITLCLCVCVCCVHCEWIKTSYKSSFTFFKFPLCRNPKRGERKYHI